MIVVNVAILKIFRKTKVARTTKPTDMDDY